MSKKNCESLKKGKNKRRKMGDSQAQEVFCLNSGNKIVRMSCFISQLRHLDRAHGKVILWRDKAVSAC